jgi:hypothetical protein
MTALAVAVMAKAAQLPQQMHPTHQVRYHEESSQQGRVQGRGSRSRARVRVRVRGVLLVAPQEKQQQQQQQQQVAVGQPVSLHLLLTPPSRLRL